MLSRKFSVGDGEGLLKSEGQSGTTAVAFARRAQKERQTHRQTDTDAHTHAHRHKHRQTHPHRHTDTHTQAFETCTGTK